MKKRLNKIEERINLINIQEVCGKLKVKCAVIVPRECWQSFSWTAIHFSNSTNELQFWADDFGLEALPPDGRILPKGHD